MAATRLSSRRSISARDAAASIRKLGTVPETQSESLPAGYARLDQLKVHGDTASVTIWYGPIRKAAKGMVSFDCGTGRSLELHRSANGEWQVTSRGVSQC